MSSPVFSDPVRSGEMLGAILDHAPGFILAIDEHGKIQFINRVLPQYDKKDVIGADWLTYMPLEQHEFLQKAFVAALATGASQTYETGVGGPSGDKVWLTTHMGPMRSGGRIVGIVLVSQEITELRRTQFEFTAASRMAAVGSLAAGIAHEINTPVQFVSDSLDFLHESTSDLLTYVDALESAGRLAAAESPSPAMTAALAAVSAAGVSADVPYLRDNLAPAFERCLEGLRRVASIVTSVREFAHPTQEGKAPADLNRAIQNTLVIARSEYRDVAELETELGHLPPVTCHIDQINQVVLNLVVNAAHSIADVVKTTGIKGRLTVRTRAEGTHVVIAISDTGTGIPEALRDSIFKPFFTTKPVGKGTGQGLALAWKLITDLHGGKLTYESKLGEGTTFVVRLPSAIPEAAAS